MLKPFLESLDGVPEALKEEYVEQDGRYVLQVEPVDGWALEDVAGLKRTISALRQETKGAKAWSALGKTPEEIQADLERLAALEAEGSSDDKLKRHKEALEKQLKTQYDGELQKRDGRIQKLSEKLKSQLVTNTALMAIKAKNGNPSLLLPVVEKRMRVDERDEDFVPIVFDPEDPETARLSTKAGSTAPMTAEELVDELAKQPDYEDAFRGPDRAGTGASPSNGRRAGKSREAYYRSEEFQKLPPSERLNIYRQDKEAASVK